MSKTLETKKRIMALLKKKEMTISELSRELGLSTATISQHMEELQEMGAAEKIDNEHFKKLKYYKAKEAASMSMAKYVIGGIGVIVVIAALFYAQILFRGQSAQQTTASAANIGANAATASTSAGGPVGTQSFACPMIDYALNGRVTSYSGFKLYYLNSSYGRIADYVMSPGSTGALNATESFSNVLNGNSTINRNKQHYVRLTIEGGNAMNESHSGISTTITPLFYNVTQNATTQVKLTVITNSTASGTYWSVIDGPCGGEVTPFLITVGSGPYTGNVTAPVNTFM